MTETLEQRIQRHEGFCAVPRLDVPPMYEIGFGHDINKAECDNYPNGISYADAEALLETDLAEVKINAAKEFPWLLGLDELRQEVIWEMCYQMGVGAVAQFRNMIAAIRVQDWQSAYSAMLDSEWHKQTPARAEELAFMMLNGYTNNPTT